MTADERWQALAALLGRRQTLFQLHSEQSGRRAALGKSAATTGRCQKQAAGASRRGPFTLCAPQTIYNTNITYKYQVKMRMSALPPTGKPCNECRYWQQGYVLFGVQREKLDTTKYVRLPFMLQYVPNCI